MFEKQFADGAVAEVGDLVDNGGCDAGGSWEVGTEAE